MIRPLKLLVVVALLGLAGCAEDDPALEDVPEPAAQEPAAGATVEVNADEYEFSGIPPELEAGETTFVLTNSGQEPHEFSLFQITSDMALEDLFELRQDELEQHIHDEGHAAAKPAKTDELTAELSAGRYGYVCFISAPDGEPHALKGMAGEFTVA
ncbi:MAG TPA: hypothetical protein VG602_02620 [Actinomycetota bacterium]|nr:hypothetical protein [Actinomycetota bacterium]